MKTPQDPATASSSEAPATDAPIETAPANGATFTASGALPAVASTSTPPAPTASEQAFGSVRAFANKVENAKIVAGNPADPNSGYFIASVPEKGARWRTGDGSFSGSVNKDGLDTRYLLDPHDALHAHVATNRSGTLAWEHDGKNEGELFGSYHDSRDYEAGARRNFGLGGGQLTAGVHHTVAGGVATDSAFGNYRNADGTTSASADLGLHDGHPAGSASVTLAPKPGESLSGSIRHDEHATALSLAASDRLSPELSVAGHLDHVAPAAGGAQTTLGLSERYRSGEVVHGVDMEAGSGARDYFKTTGSADARLGKDLYGGAWGAYEVDSGHHQSGQVGASLTLTPNEKTALTLAGVMDQTGALETRLQLDVFRSRIASVGDLADHKKDALVSLFLSYQRGGDRHMLDERFGAPQTGTPLGNQVTAGIKIKF